MSEPVYKIFRVRCLRCGDVVEWEPKKGKSCMCTCNCLELTLDAWEQGYKIFADEGEYEDLTEIIGEGTSNEKII